MADIDLERFIAAITWEQPGALEDITFDHINVLTDCFAARAVHSEMLERAQLLDLLDEKSGAGIIAALRWPPVSRVLLRREQSSCTVENLIRLLGEAVAAPIPPVLTEIDWLDAERSKRAWTSSCDAATLLDEALALLDACGFELKTFVSLCTQVISPVQAPGDILGSWSTDELIGCTVLINPGRAGHPCILAEQLVHEAVHHCQAMVESRQPFITLPELAMRPERYPSPWTGALLTAKSLLAAIAVWFSLAHFWDRIRAHVGADIADEGLQRAVAGFQGPAIERALAGFTWALDPSIPGMAGKMRATVLRRWPAYAHASLQRRPSI